MSAVLKREREGSILNRILSVPAKPIAVSSDEHTAAVRSELKPEIYTRRSRSCSLRVIVKPLYAGVVTVGDEELLPKQCWNCLPEFHS